MAIDRQRYTTEILSDFILQYGAKESLALNQLRAEIANHPYAFMTISPKTGQFMAWLIRLMQAKRVLEIGTFMGYSSLSMAEALPQDGHLITCDTSVEWTEVACRHWRSAGFADRIELRLGDAKETLKNLQDSLAPGYFDFIFIDANKSDYPLYYELSFPLLRQGGIFVFDNIFYGGRIFDESNQKISTVGIREINSLLHDDPRVEITMLSIDDGVTLALKR